MSTFNFAVSVIETATGSNHRTLLARDLRQAEKVAAGIRINLNHDRFHILIEPWVPTQEKKP